MLIIVKITTIKIFWDIVISWPNIEGKITILTTIFIGARVAILITASNALSTLL